MSWHLWLLFAATEFVLCLTPGPAVAVVSTGAMRHGRRAAVWSGFGIIAGNTLYFTLSATGLGAVLATSYALFEMVRWIGAAYLIWLGIVTFRGRPHRDDATVEGAGALPPRLFLRALTVQLSNPKALLFFTALAPQFVDPRGRYGCRSPSFAPPGQLSKPPRSRFTRAWPPACDRVCSGSCGG